VFFCPFNPLSACAAFAINDILSCFQKKKRLVKRAKKKQAAPYRRQASHTRPRNTK
jgi:hypothetical protein